MKSETFTTLDVYVAGFLRLRGHEPDLVEDAVTRRVLFTWPQTPELLRDLVEYRRDVPVGALTLSYAIKDLKASFKGLKALRHSGGRC